jgi:hypothetical protein
MNITVSSCKYVHTIDIDLTKRADADKQEDMGLLCVARARHALQTPVGTYSELHRHVLTGIFTSLQTTHGTIRKIVSRGSGNPESIDALSLARVQLEALYGLCLLFESSSYADMYLQDGWKSAYAKFLLIREECALLPRFSHFINVEAPKWLDGLRAIAGVSDAQRLTLESDQLGTPLPVGTTRTLIDRFPTPMGVIRKLVPGDKQRMLMRLYPEYQQLSTFTHGLSDSGLFRTIFSDRSVYREMFDPSKLEDMFAKDVSERAYTISLVSMVQSAAELTTLYPGDVELRAAVTDSWNDLNEGLLLGKAIWSIRSRALLGALA